MIPSVGPTRGRQRTQQPKAIRRASSESTEMADWTMARRRRPSRAASSRCGTHYFCRTPDTVAASVWPGHRIGTDPLEAMGGTES